MSAPTCDEHTRLECCDCRLLSQFLILQFWDATCGVERGGTRPRVPDRGAGTCTAAPGRLLGLQGSWVWDFSTSLLPDPSAVTCGSCVPCGLYMGQKAHAAMHAAGRRRHTRHRQRKRHAHGHASCGSWPPCRSRIWMYSAHSTSRVQVKLPSFEVMLRDERSRHMVVHVDKGCCGCTW